MELTRTPIRDCVIRELDKVLPKVLRDVILSYQPIVSTAQQLEFLDYHPMSFNDVCTRCKLGMSFCALKYETSSKKKYFYKCANGHLEVFFSDWLSRELVDTIQKLQGTQVQYLELSDLLEDEGFWKSSNGSLPSDTFWFDGKSVTNSYLAWQMYLEVHSLVWTSSNMESSR